ncbi:hypothetical protein [Amycolatopsis minnesotensis]|uniref:Uncharacterized protein n=1 Tax=Amycolatopsis minnesotensis TaxID=337894 RepID=A0ABN2Q0I2_9PSEU
MFKGTRTSAVKSTQKTALAAFLKLFTLDSEEEYVEVGERLTCEEAEALAALFGAHGHLTTAQVWLEAHETDCMGPIGRHLTIYDHTQIGIFQDV